MISIAHFNNLIALQAAGDYFQSALSCSVPLSLFIDLADSFAVANLCNLLLFCLTD